MDFFRFSEILFQEVLESSTHPADCKMLYLEDNKHMQYLGII